jgi:hypothetical protein
MDTPLLPRTIREFNRVLTLVEELAAGFDPRLQAVVVASHVRGPLFGSFAKTELILAAAFDVGLLIRSEDESVRLSDVGSQLLSLNPSRAYELQQSQFPMLMALLVEDGPLRSDAERLARAFDVDAIAGRLVLARERLKACAWRTQNCFAVFRLLGVCEEFDTGWAVTLPYARFVANLRANPAMDDSRLRAILEDQAELGRAAEILTVEWERKRLTGLKAYAEAKLVRRIGHLDLAAGYDVRSFNGVSSQFEADRLIEVKASRGTALRFFWTRNEYLTARRLRDRYFIYFLGGFSPAAGVGPLEPRIIRDPAQTLPLLPTVDMLAQLYLVTERPAAHGQFVVAPADPTGAVSRADVDWAG